MFLSTFVKKVRSLASDVFKPYGRRRRQAARVIAAEYFAGMVEQFEVRQMLSAPNLGPELSSNDLSTVFATVNGRWGESRVFDGILYAAGGATGSPVIGTLNLQTGETSTLILEGVGTASGIFKKNGEIYFTGFVVAADTSYVVAFWDKTGRLTSIPDASSSFPNDVSSTGRMALAINNNIAGYVDVGESILHHLPGIAGFNMFARSITDDNRFIGAGGSDANFNRIGVVYELNSATGEYVLSNVDFRSSTGKGMDTMNLFDSPNGVLSASLYFNSETSQDETAIFSLDGTRHAELPGIPWGNVAVGDKFVVATQGLDGYLTVFNSLYEKKTYTATELFGASGYEFQAGCLAVTADGKLVVIATRKSDGVVVVKTFEVPQDKLAQVDIGTIKGLNPKAGEALNVTWAPVTGATGYKVWINDLVSKTVVIRDLAVTDAKFSLPEGLKESRYAIWVRAIKEGQVGDWSLGQAWQVSIAPPEVTFIENSLFTWQDVQADVYQLWVNDDKGNTVLNVKVNGTSYLSDLAPGKYRVWIKAGEGSWSFPKSIEVFSHKVTPDSQSTLDETPTITWPGGNPSSITKLQIILNGNTKPVYSVELPPGSGNTHEVTTKLPRGDYQVWIQQVSGANKSIWSSSALIIGGRPVLSNTGHQINWSSYQGATKYELWIQNPAGSRVVIDHSLVTGNSFDLSTLRLPTGKYKVWIRAITSLGVTPYSYKVEVDL